LAVRLDHEAGANQTPRAGDELEIEMYSDGSTTGKTFYSGSVIVTDHGVDLTYDGEVARKYSFIGNGALDVAEVA
jgi:hypothetical protein